jgi:putative two-component system hydrogenase maturation factor HypX/HoxX
MSRANLRLATRRITDTKGSSIMRILLLATAFNSLTERVYVELSDIGHDLAVSLVRDGDDVAAAVEDFLPDVIIAPYLKCAIPESIWRPYTCLIVHPGIRGDRGASSLDWAILRGERRWGVTVLQAAAEFDAGDIWAYREFPMRLASKSALYRHEVADAAVEAICEALARFTGGGYVPEPLDRRSDLRGRLEPPMRQQDRAIDWAAPTEAVLRRLLCSDSNPGVLDTLFGERYHLYGAHREADLSGPPGQLVARRGGAVCRATGDGAVWISHLKRAKIRDTTYLKLPATVVLAPHLAGVPELAKSLGKDCDTPTTYREIWYEERNNVGYVHFEFYNGAVNTQQCRATRRVHLGPCTGDEGDRANRGTGPVVQRDRSQRDRGRRQPGARILDQHQRHGRFGARDHHHRLALGHLGSRRQRRGRRSDPGIRHR